jgi:3D (Asp-Asp-Asp) domain-containing protein
LRIRLAALLLALLVAVQPTQVEAHRVVHWSAWHRAFITGYVEQGLTALGTYTHPGECATDWGVIPPRATVQVRGLWSCHVEDSGGAVEGWHVDLWVSDVATAYAITGYRMVRYRR